MYAFCHVVLFLWPDIYLSPTLSFRLLRASKDSSSEHDSGAYIEKETSVSVIERGWKLFVPSRLRGIWAILTRRSVSPCSFLSLLALYPGWWVERLTPSTSMVWRLVPETGYALCAAFVLFFLPTLSPFLFFCQVETHWVIGFSNYWNHNLIHIGFFPITESSMGLCLYIYYVDNCTITLYFVYFPSLVQLFLKLTNWWTFKGNK